MSLKDALAEWTDWDGAMFHLGVALGAFPPDGDATGGLKYIFWSNNPLGNSLGAALEALADGGPLERRDEPDTQYRWRR